MFSPGGEILGVVLKRRLFASLVLLPMTVMHAFALDCSKAESADERAICKSPGLKKQDMQLNTAFAQRLQTADTAQKANLRASQRLWLRLERNCQGDVGCLDTAMRKRLRLLRGTPEQGPGTGSAMPLAAFTDASPDWFTVEGPRFTVADEPYKVAWNKVFDAAVANRKANPTTPTDESLGDSPDDHNYLSDEFSVTFASPNFLSGSHYGSQYYAGAAHPDWTLENINLHVPSGKPVRFEELIRADKSNALLKACAKQSDTVQGVISEEMPALKSAVTDLAFWSFSEDRATITFPPYTLGGYNQSISSCFFTLKDLRTFMQPDFKAWP